MLAHSRLGFAAKINTGILLLGAMLVSLSSANAQTEPPTFSKAFSPSTIGPGSVSTLQFEIVNSAATPATGLAFTDVLPSGVVLATPSNASTSCSFGSGGSLTAPDGGSAITLIGGQLSASASCVVSANVTSNEVATHMNVSGDLTSSGGNSGAAIADLIVSATLPGFSKSFSPNAILSGGRSTLTFTIDNTANDSHVPNLDFVDNLPIGMTVASPSQAATNCGTALIPPELTADAGSSSVSLDSNGIGSFPAVAAGSICTVTVDVIGSGTGSLGNISDHLLADFVEAGKATAMLQVTADTLIFSKSFINDPVNPGDTVDLEFTIVNTDRLSLATNIGFTNNLDTTLSGLASTGLPASDVCGAGSNLSGTSSLTLSGGNLAPGASCSFSVTLQVPVVALSDAYTSTTSAITAQINGSLYTGGVASELLFVNDAPLLTKTFIDNPVGAGDTTTLEFTISNNSTSASLDSIAFTDELTTFLPFPLAVTLPPVPDPPCGAGSILSFVSPGTERQALSLTEGSLLPGISCTFSVDVQIPAGMPQGNYLNTTSAITAVVGGDLPISVTGRSASDTLTIVAAPSLRKEFSGEPYIPGDPDIPGDPNVPVIPGNLVTLAFTLEHDALAAGDATTIEFSDDLTAVLSGLEAVGLPMADVCGTGSGISGTTNLSFTGGTLAPGDTCTFFVSLSVPATASPGDYENTTSNVVATVSGLTTTGNPAEADLTVAGLTLSKSFADDPVLPGSEVTLEFTLDNSVSTEDATDIFFTDNLDEVLTGLTVSGVPPATPCGGNLTVFGSNVLSFSGGTVTAGSECTFSVTLQVPSGAIDDTYDNVTSSLSATVGGFPVTINPAIDSLVVNSDLLMLSKSFTDDPVSPGGMVTLEFTLTNLDLAETITGITFTDDLEAALSGLAAVGLPPSDVCGLGSQLSGTGSLTFTGGNLAPGASCTFSTTLQVPSDIPLGSSATNITNAVSGMIGASPVIGAPASDALAIDSVQFSKFFAGAVRAGDTATLTFQIDNISTTNNILGISFTDDLEAFIPGLVAVGLPMSDSCGVGSLIAGTSVLSFTGGELLPGASCTFNVTVQVPITTIPGFYTNESSDLSSSGLRVAAPAMDILEVTPAPGILVSPVSGLITSEDGGTAAFNVVLESAPTSEVTVSLNSDNSAEGNPDPTTLLFTSINWNVPQIVTVTGADDAIQDGNIGYNVILDLAVSVDAGYDGIDPADVSLTNTDNDVASITVNPTAGLVTTEAGGTATFTVLLNTEPTADVTIGLSSSDTTEGTVAPAGLTFTASNWNIAQTVTVTGVDDALADGDMAYTIITAASSSTDANYTGTDPSDVSVTNIDNDVAGITVNPTAGLVTTEAGATATFTVMLNTEPTADVTIGLSSSDTTEGTAAPAGLTFTASNWNIAQTVTVTGVDDALADGDMAYTIITAASSSTDANYTGTDPSDVSVTNTDNDVAGITVNPTAGLVTTEAGGTAAFTVMLNTEPTADVTIGLSSGDTTEGTVSPAGLTFTAGNWNIAQTVTVTGVDDALADGDMAYTIITAASSSTDAIYTGTDPSDVSVTNTDNDVAGITVNPTAGLVTTEAGGTATFTVLLNTEPTADVTIGLSSSDTTEGTVAPAGLTFTLGNWNIAQTVTVIGVDDAVADGDAAYTIITAASSSTDANYTGTDPSDVSVTNTDNDVAGITVNPTAGLVTTESGGTATFTVVLNTEPIADVTIGLSSSDTTEGTVSPAGLTFTASNWNIAQTVTVTGVSDTLIDGDVAYLIVVGDPASLDPAFDVLAEADTPDVDVTNLDASTTSFTGPTATGTGMATIQIAGGNCVLDLAATEFIPVNSQILPSETEFPHGGVTFATIGCDLGASITVTLIFPQAVTAATLWKLDAIAEPSIITAFSGTSVTYTVTDGGLFDSDGVLDGRITDPAGPGVPILLAAPISVPTLDDLSKLLLMLLLSVVGWKALSVGRRSSR